MGWIETFGYLGGALTVATFSMKTMLHLRIAGIVANGAFITYGALGSVHPVLALHLCLLPLNLLRLRQLLRLTRQVAEASVGGPAADWFRPYSRQRACQAGQVLFAGGDPGDAIYFVLGGRFRALEAGADIGPGEVFGELGLLSSGHRRTQSVRCEAAGDVLVITYDEVRKLYFENPKFGFYFLELAGRRLMRDAGHAP
jgi:CRP-like cAMP-binding protein